MGEKEEQAPVATPTERQGGGKRGCGKYQGGGRKLGGGQPSRNRELEQKREISHLREKTTTREGEGRCRGGEENESPQIKRGKARKPRRPRRIGVKNEERRLPVVWVKSPAGRVSLEGIKSVENLTTTTSVQITILWEKQGREGGGWKNGGTYGKSKALQNKEKHRRAQGKKAFLTGD